MKSKTRCLLIAGISGAVGGALGAVCGSSSWIVVAVVSALFAVLVAWGISGLLK